MPRVIERVATRGVRIAFDVEGRVDVRARPCRHRIKGSAGMPANAGEAPGDP